MASKRKAQALKGEKIACQDLRQYLYSVETYRQASMLRKGREVHKIYVDVHKGLSFMDDRFSLTEFGRMVLESGSVRAGRARNVRQIVVARETLYCSGTTGCVRACGGQGQCASECDKAKVRGHKCSFRVKLTMRLGFVDHWFVEILGSHNVFKECVDSPAAYPRGKKSKSLEPTDLSVNGENSLSPTMSDETVQRNSPMPEVAALLRQNGASAAAAAAICEQYSSSPPMLYLNTASPLNIPVFPEPFSVSAHHRHRQTLAAAATAASILHHHHEPQLSSLDLSIKSELDVAGTSSSVEDRDSPMELTTKPAKDVPPSRNGHVISAAKKTIPSWSERNELLKSYLGSRSGITNGMACVKEEINGAADLSIKASVAESKESVISSYWTYQFSTPDLSRSPSPAENNFAQTTVHKEDKDDDVKNGLVIDDERVSDQEEQDGDEEVDKALMVRVQQLEAHVTQLRHIVLKKDCTNGRKDRTLRQFDFNRYNTRHVALKVAYLGWDYQGFVVQEDSEKTIEAALFDAFIKTRLVESRESANYHRCGRTDKGVSAFGQVISLDLRSNLLKGPGVKVREGGTAHLRQGETATEIRYVHILNKMLPPEIRVLAWAPVDESFSARFSCKKRTYRYYFPKGNMDLELMSRAANKLVGEHDFRNLCKMDVGNGVTSFRRRILHTEVAILDQIENGYQMCELTVVGQAFLWHQIRCIVAVIFLIAQGKEEPEILDELLNVDKCPRKPQYSMASELPLVLFDCDFGDDLEWVYEADWHEDNICHLQHMWAEHAIRATMLKRMLEELDQAKVETESDIAPWNELSPPVLQQMEWMLPGNKPRVYKPLLQRQTCESLEERIEHYAKRRKTTHPQSSSSST